MKREYPHPNPLPGRERGEERGWATGRSPLRMVCGLGVGLAIVGGEVVPGVSSTPGPVSLRHEGFAADELINQAAEDSGDEAPDVGPVGNAGVPRAELSQTLEKLEDKPESEDEDGRQVDGHDEEEEDEGADAAEGEEDDVGTGYAGDGAAGTYEGSDGIHVEGDVGPDGGETCTQVEEEENEVSESVFDVASEDPQIEHVAEEVNPAAVEEHGRKGGAPCGDGGGDVGVENADVASFADEEAPFGDFGAAGQFAGYETPLEEEDGNVYVVGEEEGAAEVEFVEEDQDVDGDKAVGDVGYGPALNAYVADGYQGVTALRKRGSGWDGRRAVFEPSLPEWWRRRSGLVS